MQCECSLWLTWMARSNIKHYREWQTLRNCVEGAVLGVYIHWQYVLCPEGHVHGQVRGCSYLLAPIYCQRTSTLQNDKTRLGSSIKAYIWCRGRTLGHVIRDVTEMFACDLKVCFVFVSFCSQLVTCKTP